MGRVSMKYQDKSDFDRDMNKLKLLQSPEFDGTTVSFERDGSPLFGEHTERENTIITPDEIRELRRQLGAPGIGMSRRWFGKYFGGKTEQTVSRWERGTGPIPASEAILMKAVLKSLAVCPRLIDKLSVQAAFKSGNIQSVIQELIAPGLASGGQIEQPQVQVQNQDEIDEHELKIKRIHGLIKNYCCHKKSCNGVMGEKCKCEWTHTEKHIREHTCDSNYLMRQLSHFGRHLADCPGYDARGFDGNVWKDEGYEGECNCGWSKIVPELPDETEVPVFQ